MQIRTFLLMFSLLIPTSTQIISATQQQITHPSWAHSIPNGIPEEINDIVEFINNREHFTAMGIKMPKGFILHGPPGTGKTSIARAMAHATGAHFFYAASSEFAQPLVGAGAKRLRDTFQKARELAKNSETKATIIFIDEIDLIGAKRTGGSLQKWNDDILTELLSQIDGFVKDSSVFIVGATNLLDTIDPALLRAGRLSRQIEIPLPDKNGRAAILRYYLSQVSLSSDVPANVATTLAGKTDTFSGADLESVVNEAAFKAVRDKQRTIQKKHLYDAIELVKKRKNVKSYFSEFLEFCNDLKKPVAQAVAVGVITGVFQMGIRTIFGEYHNSGLWQTYITPQLDKIKTWFKSTPKPISPPLAPTPQQQPAPAPAVHEPAASVEELGLATAGTAA